MKSEKINTEKIKGDDMDDILSSSWLSNKWNNFYIYGYIDDDFTEKIIIPFMEEMNKQKKLRAGVMNIYINSWGGELYKALELISLIEHCKFNGILVRTFVHGRAASAASLIAVSWKLRYVGTYARHLIHYARWGMYGSNPKQHENNHDEWKVMDAQLREIYGKYTKLKNIKDILSEDNHYISWWKKLIKLWLADLIIEEQILI